MFSALFDRFKQNKRPVTDPVQALAPLQLLGYQSTTRLLEQAKTHHLLPEFTIRHVCDFGSGTGGPTLALQQYFGIPDKRLTLLESHPPQAQQLRALFPQASLHSGDGLEWLDKTAQRFDLITAFMLGPDYEDTGFASRFLEVAIERLTPHGCLLITSDTATMHTVQTIIDNRFKPGRKWHAHWLIPEPEHAQVPCGVILNQNALPQAFSSVANLPKAMLRRALVADVNGVEEWEEHPLSTAFERAYLAATIESLSLQCPSHPGVPALQALMDESKTTGSTTSAAPNHLPPPFSSVLQAIQRQS